MYSSTVPPRQVQIGDAASFVGTTPRAIWQGAGVMSALETDGKMPYDFSPARLRCLELAAELAAHESPAS